MSIELIYSPVEEFTSEPTIHGEVLMRELTSDERRILDRMIDQLPDLRHYLNKQLAEAKVVPLDDEGSLRFFIDRSTPLLGEAVERVPVTAIFDDADGIPVYILLHIEAGRLSELEIYKADGSPIANEPIAEKLYF
jgi:hypothetical protein